MTGPSVCPSLVLAAALLSGCGYMAYFVRGAQDPIDALEVRRDPDQRSHCLVVLMPGLGDTADLFLHYGFVDDALRAGTRCDFVAVDAHLAYYGDNSLRRRVGQDIVLLASARGYREIWIVGISMGGLGAMLVARDHPGLVDGVVLIAPFLGDEAVARSVERAGGLADWEPPVIRDPDSREEYSAALWGWLRGYVEHPDRMPELYVGCGTEDPLLPTSRLLQPIVPRERFATVPGGHGWSTWRVLWRRLIARAPWGAEQ